MAVLKAATLELLQMLSGRAYSIIKVLTLQIYILRILPFTASSPKNHMSISSKRSVQIRLEILPKSLEMLDE